jgi:hypothetical protein
MLKFTDFTGNEQSGDTEGLKIVKDYPQKSRKKIRKNPAQIGKNCQHHANLEKS